MKLLCVFTTCLMLSGTAFGQTRTAERPLSRAGEAAVRHMALSQAPAAGSRRDSLVNGAIIGAVAGGVAAGVFGAWICELLREEGNPPCWRGALAVGALGAGIGAGAGAGIDALLSDGFLRPSGSRSRYPAGRVVGMAWRSSF